MMRVLVAHPLGDQDFDRLAEQLVPAPAKQSFGLAVHEVDEPVLVDHHHPVGSGF